MRFRVPVEQSQLRFNGILADGQILASATVSASATSFCEFAFPDGQNPQTTCERVVGPYLIQHRSHSVDYGELDRVMNILSSIVGN